MGMLRQIQGTFLGQAKFGKPGLGLRQVDVQFHYGPSVVTNIWLTTSNMEIIKHYFLSFLIYFERLLRYNIYF